MRHLEITRELVLKQIRLQEEMQQAGFNIVDCGHCGNLNGTSRDKSDEHGKWVKNIVMVCFILLAKKFLIHLVMLSY